MPDDAALLRRFADEHDHAAFADLVRRHVDAVYSSALRRVGGDTHLAEDVTQQVFVALARRARLAARHPALTAWLFVATHHEAANAVRSERRRKAREQLAATMSAPDPDSTASVDWTRLAPLLEAELDRLGDHDRTALLLRFFENRRYADIAATLALNEDAARRRVDRALEKLRTALARRGLTSTAAALAVALSQHAVSAAPATLAVSATAAATATTPAALTLLQLMTTAKLSTTTLAATALLVVSLGTATYEVARARNADTALALAQQADAALAARLHTVETQVAAAETDAAKLAQQLRDAEAAAAAESARRATAVVAKAAVPDPTAAGTAFMQRHPAVRQALIDWWDASTNYRYSAFYESAGLTKAQIAQFQALQRMGSYGQSLGSTGDYLQFEINPGVPWKELDDGLRTALGPDLYAKYQAYLPTLPARELGAQVAGALAFSSSPLTAAQLEQFVAALVSSHAIHGTPIPASDWPAITQNATALTPAQQEALAGIRAQAEFNAEFNRLSQPAPAAPISP